MGGYGIGLMFEIARKKREKKMNDGSSLSSMSAMNVSTIGSKKEKKLGLFRRGTPSPSYPFYIPLYNLSFARIIPLISPKKKNTHTPRFP
jgi:hypothetical protein